MPEKLNAAEPVPNVRRGGWGYHQLKAEFQRRGYEDNYVQSRASTY